MNSDSYVEPVMKPGNPVPREAILFAAKYLEPYEGVVGVEIGVDLGVNAKSIMETMPGMARLYLVDPYTVYEKRPSIDQLQSRQNRAVKYLRPHSNKILWFFGPSSEAVRLIPEAPHLVYVDGNHAKDSVLLDVTMWFSKLLPGGVLCGHDFHLSEVRSVVTAFAEEEKLKLWVSRQSPQNDWWLTKKERN